MCDMTVAARMGQTSEQILEVKKRLLPNGRRTLKMVICLNTSPLSWKHRWRKCRRVWENQMPSGSASIYWQEKSIRCISVFWSVFGRRIKGLRVNIVIRRPYCVINDALCESVLLMLVLILKGTEVHLITKSINSIPMKIIDVAGERVG